MERDYALVRTRGRELSHGESTPEEYGMPSEGDIDLDIALRKIHEPALADGDLGYAYWYQVGRLLRRAAEMQGEIDALNQELELCRARFAKTP
ncbi:hypothetical protein [Ralstonia wenshanensis]|nr:hypothetical protein [Ralstonia wenshanensis]